MDANTACAAILVACLALIIFSYLLGLEQGKASTLLSHPGYEAAMQAS
jgi:hypothetical protein